MSDAITSSDPRYGALLRKRFNKRFSARPECFRLVSSAAQVVEALEAAVRTNARVVVQSGGHCLEGFVSDPGVQVIIDTSLMSSVHYDEKLGAFAVEAGATLGEAYRKLFLGWGVALPAGQSPDIGVGGHVLGGGFGFFHRQHGLAADHLYAVEVVVVDESGRARIVTATREPSDPNRELWWAHTGCGGGNLGIVTRYFFRSPGSTGRDPKRLLPVAPDQVTTFEAEWDWKRVDEAAFSALLRNYGSWCERNSAADAPAAQLFSVLVAERAARGAIKLRGVVTAGAQSEALIEEHLACLELDIGNKPKRELAQSSWLDFVLNPFPSLFAIGPGGVAGSQVMIKVKDALLSKRHSDRQISVAYDYLARDDSSAGGTIGLATYGGRVNTVAPDDTASAQRGSIMDTSCGVAWQKPEDEATSLTWVRELYRAMFADTGGVPVPSDRTQGALINHPDTDLADPAWNTSSVPWPILYYNGNYPRLQRVKALWDPRNVFHHALSIPIKS